MNLRLFHRHISLSGVFFAAACATAPAPPRSTILFLCPYGGAKSVIAASYFNQLAEEQALPYVGVAVAAERPYDAVPQPVADFLEREGFDVHTFKPRHVKSEDVQTAARIVSIDCNLAGIELGESAVERWDDVPKVSVDLAASAAAIRAHVDALMKDLRGHD